MGPRTATGRGRAAVRAGGRDALSLRLRVNHMIAASESLGQDLTYLNWLTRH